MNRKLLAVAVSTALAMPMAAHAVKFKTSGQITRALMYGDDGQGSDVLAVDNAASGTRFRFVGSEDMGNGMKVGVNLEFSAVSNSSNGVTLKQAGDSAFAIGERHLNVWFSGNWGKVTMGQGSVATDGVAFADLDGTWLSGTENAVDAGAAIAFRTSAGGTAGGITVGGVAPSYDGGRNDNVRYDSPALGPFTLAASSSNNSAWDIMGKIAGSVGGGDYDVRLGYGDYEARSGYERWTVSGGFKFSQGTSINLTYGEADMTAATPDGSYFYAKLGHAWGNNSVAVDYKTIDDAVVNAGCTGGACGGEVWGIGFVHTMPKPKVELYAGWKNYELDDFAGAEDVDVFLVGSRVKFD